MTTMRKLAAEAAKHIDSGLSDKEFQDYDTLRYRSNALKKGALGLTAASIGSRALVQNADVINMAMGGTPGQFVMDRVAPDAVKGAVKGLKGSTNDVINPRTIKQINRFGRMARYGAIGAGIGSLALHLKAKKMDPEYRNSNPVRRAVSDITNPHTSLERYYQAYATPFANKTTIQYSATK